MFTLIVMVYINSSHAHFVDFNSVDEATDEYFAEVLNKILSRINVVAPACVNGNNLDITFTTNKKAVVRLQNFENLCGYSNTMHKFLFRSDKKALVFRQILADHGNVIFGDEKGFKRKKMAIWYSACHCNGK